MREKDPARRASGKRAQRSGDAFEREVEAANIQYARWNRGVITKIPTGVKAVTGLNGRVSFQPTEKTGCDYIGVFQGRPVALEAKSTANKTSFPLQSNGKPMVKPHQLHFLQSFEKAGGFSYILIRFAKVKRVFRVPVSFYQQLLMRAKEEGKKSLPIAWLKQEGVEIERKGFILDYLGEGIADDGPRTD